MSARLTDIWRHPIKAHGRERLEAVTLTAGAPLPFDRAWAVTHERSKAQGTEWVPCGHFSRGAKAPGLMAIDCRYDEASGQITLRHETRGEITFDPDGDVSGFLAWVAPLMPEDGLASTGILRVPGVAMTDTDFPSISLINLTSHRAVAQKIGRDISPLRWRGNLWLDGLAPWEEEEWLGRDLRIGEVVLSVREQITRCKATTASVRTGRRDADTLAALRDGWGHQEFGVYATVKQGGMIRTGDPLELL
ncbi:MOSC domain protein [Pseudoruegeria aquimaris]|uniref:MOSC domain protein n=1 Tax=Pseudoruegeria aquimaris TaxID=393663 RepID=A0A1Y5SI03_9RHOB|nr:MOSC domain-containing protein [Pseudoruegeria aquimaris]SLN38080.1 MOSC domain protein [Pseudoruegeria aquimaris]